MKRFLLLLITTVIISCSENNEIKTIKENPPINATESNLGIGINKDADLSLVFSTMNNIGFDIRQMNGFVYNSNTPSTSVNNLINLMNQKTYINTGAWSATSSSVYFYAPENKTRIINTMFNMNLTNQTDWLNTIATLNLEDNLSETKNMLISVPAGTEDYWKTQIMNYSFVKWSETYNQVCLEYVHAPVTSANVPATGTVNQAIPISLFFTVFNGCGSFGNITETNSGNTKTITVKAKYEGCFCTLPVFNLNSNYNFIATSLGIHTIRFLQPDNTFLTYTINIQ